MLKRSFVYSAVFLILLVGLPSVGQAYTCPELSISSGPRPIDAGSTLSIQVRSGSWSDWPNAVLTLRAYTTDPLNPYSREFDLTTNPFSAVSFPLSEIPKRFDPRYPQLDYTLNSVKFTLSLYDPGVQAGLCFVGPQGVTFAQEVCAVEIAGAPSGAVSREDYVRLTATGSGDMTWYLRSAAGELQQVGVGNDFSFVPGLTSGGESGSQVEVVAGTQYCQQASVVIQLEEEDPVDPCERVITGSPDWVPYPEVNRVEEGSRLDLGFEPSGLTGGFIWRVLRESGGTPVHQVVTLDPSLSIDLSESKWSPGAYTIQADSLNGLPCPFFSSFLIEAQPSCASQITGDDQYSQPPTLNPISTNEFLRLTLSDVPQTDPTNWEVIALSTGNSIGLLPATTSSFYFTPSALAIEPQNVIVRASSQERPLCTNEIYFEVEAACQVPDIVVPTGVLYPERPLQGVIPVSDDFPGSNLTWWMSTEGVAPQKIGEGPFVQHSLPPSIESTEVTLIASSPNCNPSTVIVPVGEACRITFDGIEDGVFQDLESVSVSANSTHRKISWKLVRFNHDGSTRVVGFEPSRGLKYYLDEGDLLPDRLYELWVEARPPDVPDDSEAGCTEKIQFRYIPPRDKMNQVANPNGPSGPVGNRPEIPAGIFPTASLENCPDLSITETIAPCECECPSPGDSCNPVNLATGAKTLRTIDAWFTVPGSKNFLARRHYNGLWTGTTLNGTNRLFGNWSSNWENRIEFIGDTIVERQADFTAHVYQKNENGEYQPHPVTGATVIQVDDESVVIRDLTSSTRTYSVTLNGNLQSLSDPNGNTFTLSYTPQGSLESVTDPVGRVVLFETNEDLRVVSLTLPGDPEKSTWTYTYTDEGFLQSITDPLGNTNSYSYDEDGRVTSHTNAGNFTRAWIYDEQGRVIRGIDEAGEVELFFYEDNRTTLTEEGGATWQFVFDDGGNIVQRIQPDGTIEHFHYNKVGQLVSHLDENSREQVFSYDGLLVAGRTSSTGLSREWLRAQDTGRITGVRQVDGSASSVNVDSAGNTLSHSTSTGETTSYTYNDRGQILTATTPNGGVSTYAYDHHGNRILSVDPEGKETQYEYDALSRVTGVVDHLGRRSETEYLLHSFVSATVDSLNRRSETEYDGIFRPVVFRDPDGNETRTTYTMVNGKVLPLSITQPLGRVTTYEYDNDGQTIAVTSPSGARSQTEYDGFGRVTKTTNHFGATNETVFSPDGSVHQTIGPNGGVTEFFYDEEGRQTKVKDALGNETQTVYNDRGFVVKTIAADGAETSFEHDSEGRVVRTVNALGQATQSVYSSAGQLEKTVGIGGQETTYKYDDLGRQVKVVDAAGNVTETVYNDLGQVERSVDPEGRATRFVYDSLGRRIKTVDDLNNETVTTYNDDGTVHSVTDANGHTRQFVYDILDRVVEVIDPLGFSVKTEYDQVGNRSKLIDENGNATTFEYDLLGRVTAVVDAKGQRVEHQYDAAGRKIKTINARGQEFLFEYDLLGRMTKKILPDGEETFTYDEVGRRKLAENSTASEVFAHDELGRLISKLDPRGFSALQEYSEAGDLQARYSSEGEAVQFEHDQLHRLTKVTEPSGAVTEFTYSKAGQLLTRTTEDVVTSREYDAVGRLVKLEHRTKDRDRLIAGFEYRYDSVGNRVGETEKRGRRSVVINYTYDARDQLISAEVQGPKHWKGWKRISYTYDPAGNRLTKVRDGKTTRYTYNEVNELTAIDGVELEFDADGNMLSEPVSKKRLRKYEYDSEGNLVATWIEEVQKSGKPGCKGWKRGKKHGHGASKDPIIEDLVRFFYDADGLKVRVERYDDRKQRLEEAEERFWFGGQVVEDKTLNDNDEETSRRFYLKANGDLLSAYEWTPQKRRWCSPWRRKKGHEELEDKLEVKHYLTDALGSTIATYVDRDGNRPWHRWADKLDILKEMKRFSYTPFGEMAKGDEDEQFTFTGLRNEDVGEGDVLSAMYRHLRPNLGRWVKRDPAGEIDGPNLYRFVHANPLSSTDASGLYSVASGFTEDEESIIHTSISNFKSDPVRMQRARIFVRDIYGYTDLDTLLDYQEGSFPILKHKGVFDEHPATHHAATPDEVAVYKEFFRRYRAGDHRRDVILVHEMMHYLDASFKNWGLGYAGKLMTNTESLPYFPFDKLLENNPKAGGKTTMWESSRLFFNMETPSHPVGEEGHAFESFLKTGNYQSGWARARPGVFKTRYGAFFCYEAKVSGTPLVGY